MHRNSVETSINTVHTWHEVSDLIIQVMALKLVLSVKNLLIVGCDEAASYNQHKIYRMNELEYFS